MGEPATSRVWATLTAGEAAALEQAAATRGVRASEMVRSAVLALIGQPVARQPAGMDAAVLAPVLSHLDGLAAALGRHVAELGRLVPATEDALTERDEVRDALADIAHGVGVLAGSIEPEDDGGEAAFGPDR